MPQPQSPRIRREISLYGKQNGTDAAIFWDCAALGMSEQYVGQLVYIPGLSYRLTSRNKLGKPKLFTVLGYEASGNLNETQQPEVDLLLRMFDPFREEPQQPIKQYVFPLCLEEILSPKLWNIEVVSQPKSATTLNDRVISLPMRAEVTEIAIPLTPALTQRVRTHVPKASRSVVQTSLPTQLRGETAEPPLRNPGRNNRPDTRREPQNSRSTSSRSTASRSASEQDYKSPLPATPRTFPRIDHDAHQADQCVVIAKSDTKRLRDIFDRLQRLSIAARTPWQIVEKEDYSGYTVNDANEKTLFDLTCHEVIVLHTPFSALVLQEMFSYLVRDALEVLSERSAEKELTEYAYELIPRLQAASVESASAMMQTLFNFKQSSKKRRYS